MKSYKVMLLEMNATGHSIANSYHQVSFTFETENFGSRLPDGVIVVNDKQLSNARLIPLSEYIPCRNISLVTLFNNFIHAGSRSI